MRKSTRINSAVKRALEAQEASHQETGRSIPHLLREEVLSELRWNPLLEEWVTVAPWRQDRTYPPPADHCPLCPTKPGGMETEIPEPDYHIVVFENRFPSYTGDQGRSEVVCYTPVHDSSLGAQTVDHIRDLIEVWRDRTK